MSRTKSMIGEELTMEYPSVKQIVRVLSTRGVDNPSVGVFSVETVDAYVGEWIDKGYKLISTHFLGKTGSPSEFDEGYTILYVLSKQV